jgi:hypothetical protein
VELLDELRGVAAGRVSLGALRPESVARLVRERIPEASDEVCDACHAATAGNPLYLQELLRSVTADEVAPEAGTVLKASLPTLGDRVIRRVERLDERSGPGASDGRPRQRLAPSGATNTEIAQELYVSLKTVETHLSRAYLKLGLAGSGSRARLVRVLDEASA